MTPELQAQPDAAQNGDHAQMVDRAIQANVASLGLALAALRADGSFATLAALALKSAETEPL